MVTGSTIIPASLRLTRSTSCAWASMERFLWTTPMPPSWARAIASRASVTVSMAAESSGMLRVMPSHRVVRRLTSAGWTSEKPGTMRTSSKVSARGSVRPAAPGKAWGVSSCIRFGRPEGPPAGILAQASRDRGESETSGGPGSSSLGPAVPEESGTMRPFGHRLARLVSPLALALWAPPSPAAAADTARLHLEPFTFEVGEQRVEAELGHLRVPGNRALAGSREITLRFVRFRATGARPGSPIVYLAGGPGGSGIGAAYGTRFPLFLALREHGDVIAFDQRGTGVDPRTEDDEPDTDCDEEYLVDPTKPLERAAGGAAMAEAVRRCAARLARDGFNLAGYTTRESAADLEDLRVALGAEKLTLWGISYGTHLSLA